MVMGLSSVSVLTTISGFVVLSPESPSRRQHRTLSNSRPSAQGVPNPLWRVPVGPCLRRGLGSGSLPSFPVPVGDFPGSSLGSSCSLMLPECVVSRGGCQGSGLGCVLSVTVDSRDPHLSLFSSQD